MGLLLAAALVLSFFESALSGMMALPPGVKPGFSNVVVLFALLALGRKSALTLVVLKAFFAFLTRGATAGVLSFAGGLCAVAVMALLSLSRRVGVSVWLLSAAGGIAHNAGQILTAAVLVRNVYLIFYFPLLILSGIAAGLLTAAIYRAARPYLQRSVRPPGVPKKRDG